VLRAICILSLIYDLAIGIALFFFMPELTRLFQLPAPPPVIHVRLNAVFVGLIGIGYLLPLHDPARYRAYLWIFGVVLKLAGVAVFVAEYYYGDSPQAFLVFAASDGLVAVLSFIALANTPAHHLEYIRPRQLMMGRYAGPLTSGLAYLLLPFALLRVTVFAIPPVKRDPGRDDERAGA
jgi:hypothetical protein